MNRIHAKKHPLPASSASPLSGLAFDVEAMLTACVPGGSIVDPQVVADNIRAWAAERKPAELAEQQGDDSLNTSEGGRRYVADFFARELRRHDFTRYITTTLAADFACALAQHLATTGKQPVGEVLGVDRPRLPEAFEAEFSAPGMSPVSVYTAEQMEDYARAALAARQLGGITEELDRALGQAIDQRGRYQEVADDLASHIERSTGVEIGEHSSVNFPWQNAIEAAGEYTTAQGIDLGQVREIRIAARNNLDPISVFVQDQAAGRGRIVVTCYGNAWQAFWGAMGDRTVVEFVAKCDADYVAGNMISGRQTRMTKAERAYTERIAAEVIAEFRTLLGHRDATPGVGNG